MRSTTNRPVLRASIDDFHRPCHKFRSIREEWTPQSYYDESYDYVAFRDLVLRPLGPGGDRRVRTAVFDSYHDLPVPEHWQSAPENAMLIVDGAFLQRDELRKHWDYFICLKVDADTVLDRARKRDVAWVGSADVVERRYRRRVLPTHALCESLMTPVAHADAIVDTSDLDRPRLERLAHAPVLTDGMVVVDWLSLADAHAHWVGEDDEQARRFGWYPRRSSLEGVRSFISDTQRQWRDDGPRRTLAIRKADTRTLVGGCETRLQSNGSAEVSWWIFRTYRRQGLATRGVQLMLNYFSSTENVGEFVAFIEPDNYASRRVARKTGFIEVGLDTSGPRPMLRHEFHATRQ